MKSQTVMITVPKALQHLIRRNNDLLRKYQQELLNEVAQANIEIMELLKLDSSEGWQLDMENMVYVKLEGITEQDASVAG